MPKLDIRRNILLLKRAYLGIYRKPSCLTRNPVTRREVSLDSAKVPICTLSVRYTDWRATATASGIKPRRTMTGSEGPSSPSKAREPSVVSRPSSSILLISPKNEILLLHRVQTSTSFPSAHVFPGGNLSPEQDGHIPEVDDPSRHEDGLAYRLGAIRECFEESGILLARSNGSVAHALLEVEDKAREEGRKAIHGGRVRFSEWLEQLGGVADTENLIPFTRWITPPNLPRRFTTQMYIYFLPLSTTNDLSSSSLGSLDKAKDVVIPPPTPDGGLEHTAARFLPPSRWLSMARSGEIVLFPPQYFLLHLISPFLSPEKVSENTDNGELERQRGALREFLNTGDPRWGEKCIGPVSLIGKSEDGRTVLSLEKPGFELDGTARRGDSERVVLVKFSKEGPRNVAVAWKEDVLKRERNSKGKL